MKNLLTLLLLIICFQFSIANNAPKGIIKGTVLNTSTKLPLEYATITIYNAVDGTLVNGVMTDILGEYEIQDIPFGRYYIRTSFIGFNEITQKELLIDKKTNHLFLPTITLEPYDKSTEDDIISPEINYF